MIVHVFPSYPAGTGRPLGTYILDLKNENEHKVAWSDFANINADCPAAAISAIEDFNAQKNTRYHTKSRWIHVVISFPEGEKPTREQIRIIEDRLLTRIGLGDHPRLSAMHKPDGKEVKNWHNHIALTRIDPTTGNAEHPWRNWSDLQYEAGLLEVDLGLTIERKTLRQRERQKLDRRLGQQRQFDGHALGEFQAKQRQDVSRGYTREETHPLHNLKRKMPDKLSAAAFASQIASDTHQALPAGHDSFMLQCPNGSEHAHGDKNRSLHVFEGRSGGHAYCQTGCSINDIGGAPGKGFDSIDWARHMGREVSREPASNRVAPKPLTPAQERDRVNRAAWERLNAARERNPELPDEARFFLAAEPSKPASPIQGNDERLARREAEWWRGQITKEMLVENHHLSPYENATRDQRIHNLAMALSEGRHGAAAAYAASLGPEYERIATQAAERWVGRREELKGNLPARDLYAEYKAERSAAVDARKTAENDVYQRFGQYRQEQRQFYAVQHESHKLEVIHRRERHLGHELLKAREQGDRVEARQLLTQELAAARAAHPVISWTKYLEREADRGDQEAARKLDKQRQREMQQGLER